LGCCLCGVVLVVYCCFCGVLDVVEILFCLDDGMLFLMMFYFICFCFIGVISTLELLGLMA